MSEIGTIPVIRTIAVLLSFVLLGCVDDSLLGEDYAQNTELGQLVLSLPQDSPGQQLRAAFLVDRKRGCQAPGALGISWFGPGGRALTSCQAQESDSSTTYRCEPGEFASVTEARVSLPAGTCPLIFPAPPNLFVSWCGAGGCSPWDSGLGGWSCYNLDRPVPCGGVQLFVALTGAGFEAEEELP